MDLGRAVVELAGEVEHACAAAVEDLAQLRGVDVGKILDEHLDGEMAAAPDLEVGVG